MTENAVTEKTVTENTVTENPVTENPGADTAEQAELSDAAEIRLEALPEEEAKEKTEDILEALRDVVDPELGINVVDLGLVYGVDVDTERVHHRHDPDQRGVPADRRDRGAGRGGAAGHA